MNHWDLTLLGEYDTDRAGTRMSPRPDGSIMNR